MRPIHPAVLDSHHSRPRLASRRGFRHGRRNERGAVVSRASVQPAPSRLRPANERPAHEQGRNPSPPPASEAITRVILVVVRVAMGLLLFTAGLGGVLGFAHAHGTQVQQGAMAFGGALLLTGALLPLLKGTEVLIETVLDLQRAPSCDVRTR